MDPNQAVQDIRKFETGDVTYGLMNPEQADRFWTDVYDKAIFSSMHRKERKRATSGEIDKMSVGSRLLRPKVEATDGGYRVQPSFGQILYQCVNMKLPWEVTEETYHENIEQGALEDKLMGLLTQQMALDIEDLHFNGDSTDVSGDAAFLNMNEGWVKQIIAGGQTVDGSTINAGVLGKAHMFAMVNAIDRKYFRPGNMKWIANGVTYMRWVELMTDRATGAGDAALLGGGLGAGGEVTVLKPLGIPWVEVNCLPDGMIILGDPRNFISVNTWDVRVRKTTEGFTALYQDKRFYAIYFDDDPILENPAAIAILENTALS